MPNGDGGCSYCEAPGTPEGITHKPNCPEGGLYTVPVFVQISTCVGESGIRDIAALDINGNVWCFSDFDQRWYKLPMVYKHGEQI